ncbi:fused MFS/spermidine synthase [candidate division CSSED10-310 bacterium]|uniref:Fused MFS/spermidine synthase n=1 Tax=candidate division CSSED10-310 bacterium TaxID=2855610 RepID=A0ABV6YZE3_UNCC1
MNNFFWYTFSFLSGFCALTFELLVYKIFSLQFGTTHGAGATVLAAYLLGSGLGIFLLGRLRFSILDKELGFALSQGLAGVTVALTLPVLKAIDTLFVPGILGSSTVLHYIIAFGVLLLPTFFLGGAIPLLYRVMIRKENNRGKTIGAVYGWNIAGGALGTVCTTFYLVPTLGITTSNLIIAGMLLLILGLYPLVSRAAERSSKPPQTGSERISPKGFLPSSETIVTAFLLGFCGLTLELVWMRILSTFLPNRNYSFGIILAIYLVGYALGNLIISRRILLGKDRAGRLAKILLGLSFITMTVIPLTRLLPDLLYLVRETLISPWRQVIVVPGLLSIVMVFPATVLMGMTLPLLVSLFKTEPSEIGSEVGVLFGANISGSIIGVLLAGFIFISTLGSLRTALVIAMLYTLTGCYLLLKGKKILSKKRIALRAGFLFLALEIFAFVAYPYLPKPLPVSVSREESRDDELLFYKEAASGTISVIDDQKTGIRWSYINNSAVCGTTYDALKVVRILAHLPLLLHAAPREVLVIGFGLGVTTGNISSYPVEIIDCVELCPEIVEAAPLYASFNRDVLSDRRVNLSGGDGRIWLKHSNRTYDVITCDPTHPALGSGNLYTTEFFKLAKSHLKEPGIFVQYFPLRFLTPDELKRAIATFHDIFPQSYFCLGLSHGVMVGSTSSLSIDPQLWRERLRINPARSDLMKSSLARIYDWLALIMMGPQELTQFCHNIPLVTDDKPVLEYPGFNSLHPFTWSRNLDSLMPMRNIKAVLRILTEESKQDKTFLTTLERFFEAKTLLIKGNSALGRGNIDQALHYLGKAKRLNWDDEEIRNFHQYLSQLRAAEKLQQYQ